MINSKRSYPFDKTILILLAVVMLLQLGVCLLTYGYALSFDESIWHYIGRNWFRLGLTPYRGGVDNKSPLIFMIYGLSDKLFGVNYWFPRVVGVLCQMTGIWFLYRCAFQLAGRRAGILVISLYGLSLLWHGTGGKFSSVTETWSATSLIIALYYFLTPTPRRIFISGLFAGLGFAFRPTALAGLLAIFLFCWGQRDRKSPLWFFFGVIGCLGLLIGAATLAGIPLHDFWAHAFADNFDKGGITDRAFDAKLESFVNGFFYSELILFYPLLAGYFLIGQRLDVIGCWFLFASIFIIRIGIYDPSHFKELLPSLSLAGALCIDHLCSRYRVPFKKTLAVVWLCFLPKVTEPLICLKRMMYPVAAATPESYCQSPWSPLDNYSRKELGLWIRANTDVGDRVLIAGHGAQIQVYTERLSPAVYFDANPTRRAKDVFYRQVTDNLPGMVAVPLSGDYELYVDGETRGFVRDLVAQHYKADTCLYGHTIYRLKR